MTTELLAEFIAQHPKLMVLTGAGVSAASGIPTYRDDAGVWQSVTPIQHQEFLADKARRQRYWARSAVGWPNVAKATPNLAHQSLAKLEAAGFVVQLVTQNVDGLHQQAGHQRVLDLHGRIDQTVCLNCGLTEHRESVQKRLLSTNPQLVERLTTRPIKPAPDGDAHLDDSWLMHVNVPHCLHCDGLLKPDVVFFGGTVSRHLVDRASESLRQADALLVVGSSLQVYSGFRFCKLAQSLAKPVIAINKGITRADSMLQIKIDADCGQTLTALTRQLRN